jgi:hypothetical protein
MGNNDKESADSWVQQYLDRAEALRLTPAFNDENDPLHSKVIDEIDRLYGFAYPEEGAPAATPSDPIKTPRARLGNFKPDELFQTFWDQAKELKISPPASDSLQDIVEFQTRVSKQTENTYPVRPGQASGRYKPWGI